MKSVTRFVRHSLVKLVVFLLLPVFLNGAVVTKAGGANKNGTSLYGVAPAPMTVAECGRCHPGQFRSLKESGGKHRFECQRCHETFHAHNRLRKNFDDLMPRCDNCHPAPHGGTLTDCLGCHDNPHAPLRPAGMQQLSEKCGDCHRKPAKQLAEFPSAHSRQGCTTCHSERHGRIPECTECHKPHYDEPNTGACWVCHPAHQPLQITLAADTAPKYCATCHSDVFTVWSGTTSRHGQVNCAVCHVQHARIPACLDCHQPPHDEKMLARFKNCLGCHIDPHNLPTNYK